MSEVAAAAVGGTGPADTITRPLGQADLAVIILTHNEERHIGRALDALAPVAREVFVIDSFSTDRTVEIARERGATVLQNRFINYAKQFQWGLDNAPVTSAWVMRLDADEVVEPDLAAEIRAKLVSLPVDVQGVVLKRKHIFMDRWIRHGGRYPLLLLRIWRTGAGRIEDRWMDEHIVLSHGRTVTFDGGFADHNLNDLTFFTDKHNKYATREAIDILADRYDLYPRDRALTETDRLAQASWKRVAKEKIYNRLPFQVGPMAFFLYRYIVQLGFSTESPGSSTTFSRDFGIASWLTRRSMNWSRRSRARKAGTPSWPRYPA